MVTMFGNLGERYSGVQLATYNEVFESASKEFQSKVGTLTVFHKILMDRVADAYTKLVCTDITDHDPRRQENLQKWLNVALSELHSAEMELQARRGFYEKVVDILDDSISDDQLRKTILLAIKVIVQERDVK